MSINKNKKPNVGQIIKDVIVNGIMILSIAIFCLALFTMYKHKDNPNEAFLLGFKPVYVMTGSMEPTLRVNGIVIIKQAAYDEIKVDDIIMYEIDDKMITHRVVEITDEGIRTKGDNNNVQDAYLLQPENIRGKAVSIWNWTATVINKWNSSEGRIQIIAILALIMCAILLTIGIKMVLKARNKSDDPECNDKNMEPDCDSRPKKSIFVSKEPSEPKASHPRHALSLDESLNTIYIPILSERKIEK